MRDGLGLDWRRVLVIFGSDGALQGLDEVECGEGQSHRINAFLKRQTEERAIKESAASRIA
jgi:hypothetical protein